MPDVADTPSAAPTTRKWLRLAVLTSGAATMAIQMCAVRLLAPWVGASSLVWATIIGLSLLAMASGYALGGRLADRRIDGATLASTLLGAAALIAMIPITAPLILPHADLGLGNAAAASVAGAAVGYLTLFLAPSLLLGITPPYAIRLAMATVSVAGSTAGRVYALSTIGSIIGTLLAALVLVQWIGTRATLWAVATALVVGALAARRVATAVTAPARAPASPFPGSPATLAMPIAAGIVVVEGMATMGVEMSVARLIAPFYGASHIVWANLIALVMGSIALGSWLGGRMADRRPTLGALTTLLSIAAMAVAVLPFVAAPVMRLATGGIDQIAIGTMLGSFLATMAIVIVPVTLLGMVPPWVVRLAVPDLQRAGRTVGYLYALSTAGALTGTFASALWLIPAIGTRRTLLGFAGLLALLAILAAGHLWTSNASAGARVLRSIAAPSVAVALVCGLLFAPTGLIKPLADGRVVAEDDSRYQFIQVVDQDNRRLLQLNEGWAVHSIYDARTILTGGIWDHFLVLPALLDREAASLLIIGNAAGTAPRAYRSVHPQVEIDGVELDAAVTRIGRRYFEMAGDNLRITTADGRPFLAHAGSRDWDLIHVDAYRQPYIPFYLTTREFFALAKQRLAPGGALSINVGSTPSDPRINEAIAATMREEFSLVTRYRAETYNEVIVAINDPDVTVRDLQERIRAADRELGRTIEGVSPVDRAGLRRLHANFASGMREVARSPDLALTDDRAPVEWMTDRMIFGEADAG